MYRCSCYSGTTAVKDDARTRARSIESLAWHLSSQACTAAFTAALKHAHLAVSTEDACPDVCRISYTHVFELVTTTADVWPGQLRRPTGNVITVVWVRDTALLYPHPAVPPPCRGLLQRVCGSCVGAHHITRVDRLGSQTVLSCAEPVCMAALRTGATRSAWYSGGGCNTCCECSHGSPWYSS